MKRLIAITLALLSLAALSACKDNPAQEYGKAVVGTMDRAERAADTANLDSLRKSIEAYRAANGKYPETLDEVALGLDPSLYNYDPATGSVSLKQ